MAEALIIALRPAIFDRDAPPLNESRAVQALEESGNDETQIILRQAAQKSDHRHYRLLSRAPQRPRESLSAACSRIWKAAGPAGQPSHIFHRRCACPAPPLQWDGVRRWVMGKCAEAPRRKRGKDKGCYQR